ncbi:response regulator transcription factor, partial [Streptomyces sp. NPDC056296]|uniref:response regulator transcription factor n=1 Tax=Streptomyces sp. NPDC056296 TaxID=3345775 RepID=UPI0035E36828
MTPLVVQAYELSERELEVSRRVARGLSTSGISEELHLSPHTVRDHIKAIFEKLGVSSRGELVGQLFTEYYEAVDPSSTAARGGAAGGGGGVAGVGWEGGEEEGSGVVSVGMRK